MKKGSLVQIQHVINNRKQIAILVEDVVMNSGTAIAMFMTREHPRPMVLKLDIEDGLLYFSHDRDFGYFLQEGQYEEEYVQLKRMVMYTNVK